MSVHEDHVHNLGSPGTSSEQKIARKHNKFVLAAGVYTDPPAD